MTVAEAIEALREMPAEATLQLNPGGKFYPLDVVGIALRLDGAPVRDYALLEDPSRYCVELW